MKNQEAKEQEAPENLTWELEQEISRIMLILAEEEPAIENLKDLRNPTMLPNQTSESLSWSWGNTTGRRGNRVPKRYDYKDKKRLQAWEKCTRTDGRNWRCNNERMIGYNHCELHVTQKRELQRRAQKKKKSIKILELRLVQASLLKKILESIQDLVTNANFDCSATGLSLEAVDLSCVASVALLLRSEGFDSYRCDANISLGMNIGNMSNILKCAGDDDIITLKANDSGDTVTFMFESPSTQNNKISEFQMKLMDIDSEHLRIPDAEYQSIVKMPSAEFARICSDLASIGDTVVISVTKESVEFSTLGDVGRANIILRQNTTVNKPEEATVIQMSAPNSSVFELKYMNEFTKATPLSSTVTIHLSTELSGLVEYEITDIGYIRFYLAQVCQ